MEGKIIIDFISANEKNVVEGDLSIDISEVEKIECKDDYALLFFPGVNITVPLPLCDKIKEVVDTHRSRT